MKNMKKILALLLVLLMFVQASPVTIVVFAASDKQYDYSDTSNSGLRDQIATTLNGTGADAYYNGSYEYEVLSQQSASAIKSALATLMTSTHSYKSSYDDCHYKADLTDCENNNGKVSLIYTMYSATMNQWNGWNREHVWPKSLGGDTTTGGGADLHHIRPSDATVNSTRGNKKYGNVSGGTQVYGSNPASGYLGGTYSGNYFEPNDNVKGDVARICLYVHVRWGSAWGASNITSVFQSVDVLLQWCEMDPVDTWELGRNEVVEAIQGNRNVFIDYPEYAWLIFGYEVPENLVSPTSGNTTGSGSTTPTNPAPTTPPVTEPQPTQPESPFVGTGTVDFSDKTYRTEQDGNKQVWKQDGITVTNNKANSITNVADYANPARFYANSQLIIAAPGMKRIEFTCNNSSYASALLKSIATNAVCTATSNGSVVTVSFSNPVDNFTIEQLTAQVRINSLSVQADVTVPPATEPTPTQPAVTPTEPSVNPTEPQPTEPPIDLPANTDGFKEAVTLATTATTGDSKFNALKEAVTIYNSLSSADKASVAQEYQLLLEAAGAYNQIAQQLNSDKESEHRAIIGATVLSVSVISYAAVQLLSKKYL